MFNLETLKHLDVERLDFDELIALSAFAKLLRAEYESASEVPEWLDDAGRSLKRDLQARQADATEKRLRELKARRETLKTPDQKRADIDKEIADLEQKKQLVGV